MRACVRARVCEIITQPFGKYVNKWAAGSAIITNHGQNPNITFH